MAFYNLFGDKDLDFERAKSEGRHPAPDAAIDTDFPISELRIVKVAFMHGLNNPRVHYMHKSQVEAYVKATVELHHVRGNPHTGKPLDNLARITVEGLATRTITYWWCAASLEDDGTGARLNDEVIHAPPREVAWVRGDNVKA
jgi:hypothetical protein